jgi:hypothetical protein
MSARLTVLRERPIADSERPIALVVGATLLLAATVALLITRPSSQHPARRPDPPAIAAASPAYLPKPPQDPTSQQPPPAATRIAREFLAGYLAYLYGHAPARRVSDASASLRRSLEAREPRISPAIRARRPRVVSLSITASGGATFIATALIGDGGVADYPVGVLLVQRRGRLLVGGLEGEG